MPVYTLTCPDCGHRFQGMVLAGTRPPRIWECSKCGSRDAAPDPDVPPLVHPWEGQGHGAGCLCCSPAPRGAKPSEEERWEPGTSDTKP